MAALPLRAGQSRLRAKRRRGASAGRVGTRFSDFLSVPVRRPQRGGGRCYDRGRLLALLQRGRRLRGAARRAGTQRNSRGLEGGRIALGPVLTRSRNVTRAASSFFELGGLGCRQLRHGNGRRSNGGTGTWTTAARTRPAFGVGYGGGFAPSSGKTCSIP